MNSRCSCQQSRQAEPPNIRVHEGARAKRTTTALHSQAFTAGHHIVLGTEASDPLLVHEVSAGVAGGDVSFGRVGDRPGVAGFGSAGLEFRLDELLAMGAEYQVLGEVAKRDPLVQRLLINLRVPF